MYLFPLIMVLFRVAKKYVKHSNVHAMQTKPGHSERSFFGTREIKVKPLGKKDFIWFAFL